MHKYLSFNQISRVACTKVVTRKKRILQESVFKVLNAARFSAVIATGMFLVSENAEFIFLSEHVFLEEL